MKAKYGIIAVLIAATAGAIWWLSHATSHSDTFRLYGNVEQRQVSLAFNGSERITDVLVEEGDRVTEGDVVAKLETDRLELQVLQAQGQVAAQQAVLERLRAGSRPGEIEQARANLASAEADVADARSQYDRQAQLLERTLTSQQQVDSAKAALDAAVARARAAREARDLLIVGSRHEDILQAEAQLKVAEAQLKLLERQLADATLASPVDGVVRSRLLEPGDMASPERPVLSLAIMNPKWVRAYVSEVDLGRVREGLDAYVVVDAFSDRRYRGRIGFISSVAEFTPKNVETEDLRTSLVYEVRVLVEDPADELRLGMPATVHLLPQEAAAAPPESAPGAEDAVSLADPGA